MIRDIYPNGWKAGDYQAEGRLVELHLHNDLTDAWVSMGISPLGTTMELHLEGEEVRNIALARRCADAAAHAMLAVITAHRAGDVAEVEADLPIPYTLTTPGEAAE